MSRTNNSMLIFIPNIQSKEDLQTRLHTLVNDISIDNKEISPSNMIAGGEYEYDCFPGGMSYMAEVYTYIEYTSKIISYLQGFGYSQCKFTYHTPVDDEDEYCGGEPETQDYVSITAVNGNLKIDLDFYMDSKTINCEVENVSAECRAYVEDVPADDLTALNPTLEILCKA